MATHVHIRRRQGPRAWIALLGFLAIVFAVAGLGFWAAASGLADWYPTLVKPGFTPPNWLFGPAWSVLYAMMAAAAWLVWRRADFSEAGPAFGLFGLQLALNIAWSVLFFALRRPAFALADCIALFLTVALTALAFRRFDGTAALLLMPYLAWIGFAIALNAGIVALN